MSPILPLVLATVCVSYCDAKIFSRCEFVSELIKVGVKENLADWVCLAENGSKGGIDTRRIKLTTSPRHNIELGLFKISTQYWCEDFRSVPNSCGIHCRQLLDDDIADDVKCAQNIMKIHNGLEAFEVWQKNCKGKNITKYTDGCDM